MTATVKYLAATYQGNVEREVLVSCYETDKNEHIIEKAKQRLKSVGLLPFGAHGWKVVKRVF